MPTPKRIKHIQHPMLSREKQWSKGTLNEGEITENLMRLLHKKLTPKEYVNLISGVYTPQMSGYDMRDLHLDNLKDHPLNNERNNDAALKRLRDHISAPRPKQQPEGKQLNAASYVKEILNGMKISPKMISAIIKNPKGFGFVDEDDTIDKEALAEALSKQPNVNKEHLMALASNPHRSLGNLTRHPAMDAEVANTLIDHKMDRLSSDQMSDMLKSRKSKDPSKHLIDDKRLEDMLLNGKTRFSAPSSRYDSRQAVHDFTGDMLSSVAPTTNPDGSQDWSKRNELVDKLLGIHGGKRHNETLEDAGDEDSFGYDNWANGPHRVYHDSSAEQIASLPFLQPHQIEHIKRNGSHAEKYALFSNPHIDEKHAREMYTHWLNDDTNKGYDLDDLKSSIKEEHPFDKMYDDLHEEARDQAEEEYPMSEHTHGWTDDDWVSRQDFDDRYLENNPDASEEEMDRAYAEEVRYAREEQTPDSVYESYDDSIRDDIYRLAERRYDDLMDEAHENYDFLPSHLKGKLPSVEEAMANRAAQERENARIKAEHEERENQEFFNEKIPNRMHEHQYGDLQHHVEMAKQYADANGGAIDVGSLNRAHPNIKDKWKAIFGPKGKLTSQELDQKLQELPKTKYNITYKPWKSNLQNINQRDQVVFRLDHSPESMKEIEQDPSLLNTFNKISEVSQRSGHPTNNNTIAWARVDTNDPNNWMIDEVQSDFASSARDYLEEHGKPEEAANVDKIMQIHKNWREALVNHVLKAAKAHGAKRVSTHSPESKAAHTGADKVHTVYKDSYQKVPRAMGFRSASHEELPLNERGQGTFLSQRSGTPVNDLLEMHRNAMNEHAKQWMMHADMRQNPVEDQFVPAHKELANHHYDLFTQHQQKLSQLDPSSPLVPMKLPQQFLSRNKIQPVHEDRNQAVEHAKKVTNNEMKAPVYGFDSALKEAAEMVTGHLGHAFDLTPAAIKKALAEVEDLMKKEMDQGTRTKIAMTLKNIQQNGEVIEQMRQTNPEAYKSLQSLVQALVELFKRKTGQDPQQAIHEMEIKEQLQAEQAAQQQGQGGEGGGQAPQGQPKQDEPLHGKQLVYAPGSIRRYTSQDERVKQPDGEWSAFSGGLQDPSEGQQ